MNFIKQLENFQKRGMQYRDEKKYKNALEIFYEGALKARKLVQTAPTAVQKEMWMKYYKHFQSLIKDTREKEKEFSSIEQKNYHSGSKVSKRKIIQSESSELQKKRQNIKSNTDSIENIEFTDEEIQFVNFEPFKKSFNDIIGLEKAKKELSYLQTFFEKPEYFKKLNVDPVKGILLFGPPGCGKTFIIECTCGEFGVNLVTGSAADLKGKYVGESENKAKAMFSAARKCGPCILFIDEIDKILPINRGESGATQGLLQVFLVELIKNHPEYIAVMATNYPQEIETAVIMNKKRINNIIYVGPPNTEARKKIFKLELKYVDFESGFSLEEAINILAEKSQETFNGNRYSASNCSSFCGTLKRNLIDLWREEGDDSIPMSRKMVENFLDRFVPDISHQQIEMYEKFAKEWAQI